MTKVRVYEVARQLGMNNRELVTLFQSMGFAEVRNHMSAVESEAVERVRRKLERRQEPEVTEERIRPTVVKRRGRRTEGAVKPAAASAPSAEALKAPVKPAAAKAPSAAAVKPKVRPSRRVAEAPKAEETKPAAQDRGQATAVSAGRAPAPLQPPETKPDKLVAAVQSEQALAAAPAPGTVAEAAPAAEAASPPPTAEPEPLTVAAAEPAAGAAGEEPARAPLAEPTAAEQMAEEGAPPLEQMPEAATASAPGAEVEQPTTREAELEELEEPEELEAAAEEELDHAAHPSLGDEPQTMFLVGDDLAKMLPPEQPGDNQDRAPAGAVRRQSAPPKSGIEVWGGRPGVPMPQRPRAGAGPHQRRTTYDARANASAGRPGYGGYGRTVPGRPMRPGFRRGPGQIYGRGQRKGPSEVSTKEMSARKMVIKIDGAVSLQALAGKMSLKATDVLMKLLGMGMTNVNINSTLDVDTAKLLAGEFGWALEDVSVDEETAIEAAIGLDAEEESEMTELRPPIVTVMGHVDHGKTTLLDTIRKTTVAADEAGGITQHIGAYRVDTKKGVITFLDTPGHEAFTAMRARGASVTDIVILIVAADDGVMPQTREAINHAKSADVPIIVAINKMDKPGIDPERIMRDLANEGLQPEDWGGDTIFCKISAKTGDGIDQLLEMVVLQAELLELRARPQMRAQGVVVEALLDRGRGPVARVLVIDGTLLTNDVLLAGHAYGKVRAMIDEKGRKVKMAGPSTPVEVLGLNEVPQAGDPVHAVKGVKAAEAIAGDRRKKVVKARPDSRISPKDIMEWLSESEQYVLKVIIKADVQGSVEALTHALSRLSTDKVKLEVVHTGVGGVTETDVNLAAAARAMIIGFNVRPAGKAKKSAEAEAVEIRLHNIIYEVIDEVRGAMEGLLPATKVEKELGRAEVRQLFRISRVGAIAGCLVLNGVIRRSAEGRVVRDSKVVWTGKIGSVRRFKEDAKEVREGLECGISLENFSDVKEGDIIEAFQIEEVKATL